MVLHHLHKDKHPNGLRVWNIVFVALGLILALVGVAISKDIVGFFIGNLYLLLNLIFLLLPHHQLIGFLKCRICLVYILFAFFTVWYVIALLGLLAFSALVAGANEAVQSGTFDDSTTSSNSTTPAASDNSTVVAANSTLVLSSNSTTNSTTDSKQDVQSAVDTLQAYTWLFIFYYLVAFGQGLTWVLYTSKLASEFHNELGGGEYHKA